jgi:hypothetical protein
VNPSDNLALQASIGNITNPEGTGLNVTRATLSAIYGVLMDDGWWSTTAVWGQNKEQGHHSLPALLLESAYALSRFTFFGRTEYIQKTDHELDISHDSDTVRSLVTASLGATYQVLSFAQAAVDIGAAVTFNFVPEALHSVYGNMPLGYQVFISLHPTWMR